MLLSCHWSLNPPISQGVWHPFFEAPRQREQVSLQFHNAQPLESQSGKFALAPAGLEDERALG